jgi:hypothetical protein
MFALYAVDRKEYDYLNIGGVWPLWCFFAHGVVGVCLTLESAMLLSELTNSLEM